MIDRPRAIRWIVVAIAIGAAIWAAEAALEAMGAQRAENDRIRKDLRSAQGQVAAVLKTNAQLADSNQTLARVATAARSRANAAARQAEVFEHQADLLRAERAHRQPLGSATPSDSIAFYREAAAIADRENDMLRQALEQRWEQLAAKDSIEQFQRRQIALLTAAKDSAVAVLTRVQPVLSGADKALAHSETRCRIVKIVPCPSRTISFVAGAGAAVLAYQAIRR